MKVKIEMIFRRPETDDKISERQSWRAYQAGLKRTAAKKRLTKGIFKYTPFLAIIAVAAFALTVGFIRSINYYTCKKVVPAIDTAETVFKESKKICKNNVRDLLGNHSFVNLKDKRFNITFDDKNYWVDTTLDIALQNFILKKIDRSTSKYIGIVIMEPLTGRILSMIGFNRIDTLSNPCVDKKFPAASIFKIITAAASVEKCGFSCSSKFKFNGNKYTLYKTQLKDRTNRYTNRITFKDSFAQSVNPVFGKIGANYLGKEAIEKYAAAFGFNREINFEIPVVKSEVFLSAEPYHWAEIACGFNRETTITTIHGAMLASAIINSGSLIEPTIIDQITNENGQVVYHNRATVINKTITQGTSNIVFDLMKATVKSGTSRKAFRGYRKDRILSKLDIGGKTGSIDNKSHEVRFDWFVGFAEEKNGSGKIAVSVVVAHEKYIGKRAGYYARIAIKEYFNNYFAKNRTDKVKFKS